MKINLEDVSLTPLMIALEQYLTQFSFETLITALPESAIADNIRTYNQVRNLFLGNHRTYRLNEVPEHLSISIRRRVEMGEKVTDLTGKHAVQLTMKHYQG